MEIQIEVERLLQFALQKDLITSWDLIPCRNALLDLLAIEEPGEEMLSSEVPDDISSILEPILDYCANKGLLKENTNTYRDLMDTKIMGILTPRAAEIIQKFRSLYAHGPEDATNYFYQLSQRTNYIRRGRIEKNIDWKSPTPYGELEITINLSKPEKTPEEIESAKAAPASNYPKCVLCVENVGYSGRMNHPARQNHRVIPITLNGERWYLQYSPYVYYNEHCIVLKEEHVPMKISKDSFCRLFDFVEQFPHYFLGSNADLPIVGGSILSHDHFQGGNHIFPMAKAPIKEKFYYSSDPSVQIGIVDWPLSAIRLSSEKKESLTDLSAFILEKWKKYSDEDLDILSCTKDEAGRWVPHNTITPIVRKNHHAFEIDLVLRNNRRTKEHPDGLFHPHRHLHHIKKENIGLIEVMGLAVLPGRLKKELEEISKILTGEIPFEKVYSEEKKTLEKHKNWIESMISHYGTSLNHKEASVLLRKEVGEKFCEVLECAGVFKHNRPGEEGFIRFMESLGIMHL